VNSILLVILSGLLLGYPLFVFFGLQYFEVRYIGMATLALVVLRLLVFRKVLSWSRVKPLLPLALSSIVLCIFIVIFNAPLLVKLNPVLISLVMLVTFGLSLLRPPSMVERFARLSDSDLPDQAIPYTRNVTMVWCIVFVVNGSIAAYTALFSSIEVWTLYNGLISYLLMGLVFLVEYLVRIKKQRSFEKLPNE